MTELAALPKRGDVIDGKYRVDHRIGSGAMSVVYQVTHRVTEKRFALKWLLPELAAVDDFAQRFLREAQVAGRFEHPNVVEVYDVGSSNGGFYMLLELLSGESLEQRIARADELPWADACRLLLPCFHAVAEAHDHGIVHRDLKPGNIFVCKATKASPEHTKVLDFGLAKLARIAGEPTLTGTRSGVVMGTPSYMPLEQMRGEAIDERADIYALAVTLYQAVTGRLPFHAASFADLILVMATETPAPLERWARGVPEGLSAVVIRALAHLPEDRPPNMHAFLAALAPFVPPGIDIEPHKRASKAAVPSAGAAPKPQLSKPARAGNAPQARRPWLLRVVIACGLAASAVVAHHGAGAFMQRHKPVAPSTHRTPPAPNQPPANAEAKAAEPAVVQPAIAPELPRSSPAIVLPETVITSEQPRAAQATAGSGPAPTEAGQPPAQNAGNDTDPQQPEDSTQTGRQWRQTHAFALPPPPEPRAGEPAPAESTPPPKPRPTRLRPLQKDEF